MAHPLGSAEPNVLLLRFLSAAILAPVAVAAAWLGGAFLAALTLTAAALMGWEWGRLTRGGRSEPPVFYVVATELAGVGAAALGYPLLALALILAGSAAGMLLPPRDGSSARIWAALGTLWIGAPCVALLWLGGDAGTGRITVLWLFALVWATDSGAYLVGRLVGGPRLAPRWSPKKTWSGALGGLAAAGAVGAIVAKVLGVSALSPVFWVSLGLSVAEQMGDLAESAAKRRFGVKDTSGLIPGHGGVLDRLDGMLAVLAATAALALAGGASPVTWR